jgi:regulator of sigma D
MDDNLQTLPTIGKQLDTPITTLRYRVKQCEEFIPYVANGDDKLYDEDAAKIIREINDYYNKNLKTAEILRKLSKTYDRQVAIYDEQLPTTTDEQRLNPYAQIEVLTGIINELRSDIKEIKVVQQEQAIAQQEDRKATSEHYRLVDERLRQIMEQETKQDRTGVPWWKLFLGIK